MRSGQRGSRALATGAALLLAATACADTPEPAPEPTTPQPPPTVYEGEVPPGLAEEPLRFLHGGESPGQEILADPLGVRIQAVGDAFLISSNSEERHLLQGAGDGRLLWEGASRVERFTRDGSGSDVFEVSTSDGDASVRTVLDQTGERVWTGTDPRESYLNGLVVRAPADWSAGEPYGEFSVGGPGDGAEWTYEFTEPAEPAEDEPEAGSEEEPGDGGPPEDAEEDAGHMGVPVAARGDVVLLDDGVGMLQARDISDEGALLWSVSGDSPGFEDEALSRPRPRLVGFYELPEGEGAEESEEPSGTPSPDRDSEERAGPRETALIRWGSPEEPSMLSLHDLGDGELLWSLREPGTNAADGGFDSAPVAGVVWDPATGTLLLPQTGGPTPMVAVDLASGEPLWEFEDRDERSLAPRFALSGYVYGDSRADDGVSQVVLEAETKDLVVDDLPGYVEAVTADGHALVVQNRQRFVFAPETPIGPTATPPPTPSEQD
ncbi:hypothetical protein [Actinorugispora endophytica]|uniref:Pyrroloquinoline-quinone binding quinoprotein n=1 Tax=Actinorugispora endophytica TaxID=1605990 RepID=A0A4R6V3U3_9ACTN|nr:hypothetical protein [Actinorugispora endophytica]TDQ54951.1 hypothetical protein EV190_101270 [Actinorugispora endophytica]